DKIAARNKSLLLVKVGIHDLENINVGSEFLQPLSKAIRPANGRSIARLPGNDNDIPGTIERLIERLRREDPLLINVWASEALDVLVCSLVHRGVDKGHRNTCRLCFDQSRNIR